MDTPDEDFIIGKQNSGLVIATGGSGHAFKVSDTLPCWFGFINVSTVLAHNRSISRRCYRGKTRPCPCRKVLAAACFCGTLGVIEIESSQEERVGRG
jgi:hypothetical protein